MKRFVVSLWICWAAYCGYQSNTIPLAFGMTIPESAAALGVPLFYHSGQHGSEIYLAYGQAMVVGAYPVASAIALQYRDRGPPSRPAPLRCAIRSTALAWPRRWDSRATGWPSTTTCPRLRAPRPRS